MRSGSSSKTAAEIDEDVTNYLAYQREYNETGNTEVLWFKMRPILEGMVGSAMKKLSHNHYILDFDTKLETACDNIIARYIKNPSYSRDLPKTLAYWAAVGVMYGNTAKSLDMEQKLISALKNTMYIGDYYEENEEVCLYEG